MKGRSHRLQSHDAAHEDWVDGSWTVDCVCGVNFDDGEEMVNCDECGVWVHTRCSRYVKGDELFTCHKCKSKNNNRNDNEETEVAQLLVELPTTTIRLETRNAANGPSRRPFRLWTDIPREKRVHVQGIPGGDPSLFTGLSSVFTPQLWKCTGYVPKKFNFQYREFPCWDEKEEGDAVVNEVENQNTVDKGAGILFSLSKENVLATSAAALIHMRGTDEQAGCDEKVHSKQMKKWEDEIAEVRHLQIGVKKDKSLLQPIVIQSGKQKSKEVGIPKDCNRKKQSRAAEKEVGLNKKGLHDPKSVFTSTSDGKPLEYHEDGGSKSFRNDSQSPKNKNVMETIFQGCESDSCTALGNKAEKPSDNLALVEYSSETLSVEMSRNIFPAGTRLDEGKGRHEVLMGFDNPPKVNLVTLSDLEHDVGKMPVKQEGDGMLHANPDGIAEGSAGSDVKPDELATVTLEVEDFRINGDCGMFPTLQPDVEVEVADRETRQVLNCPSFTDVKEAETSNSMPENSKQNDSTISSSPLTDYKSRETVEAISESHAEKVQELSGKTCLLKQDLDGSENTIPMLKCPLEPKRGSGFAEEPSKSGGANLNSPALPNTVNSNPDTKQQVTTDANSSIKNDRATSSVARDDDNMSIKITKERSKSSINSMSKVPNSSKTAPTYLPKKILPDSKDSLIYSSSKVSSAQNSSEAAGLPRNDSASYAQHKPSTSGLPLRSEKFVQSNSQASSKANYTLSMNPSAPANSPAALSDEELALLLHQELNSSPRVPRVPRVRHASSLHQLASPMASSMLMKRTYSAGTKDSILRSKSRDASKDGFCQSHEHDDEDRRTNRMPSPNQRRQNNKGYTTETSSKRGDSGSPTSKHSVKKNVPTISTSTANSGPSSSTEISDHHLSSMRGSPMSISDEETGTILGPVPQTLPGLIDEIMSKGKRMTYEELCNAVLPHWHNLRKHNGERYAYSSHSQAVLDCLRNRHKWARLVDRGPKTNSSRKRRKLDAEDLEDDDYGEGRARKEGEAKGLESQREDFPKGKRKARKRRRLALQGRGIKDVRKRHKSNSHTDEDIGSFSNSSEESLFSEDETQGSGGGTVGVEASATSDEEGTR